MSEAPDQRWVLQKLAEYERQMKELEDAIVLRNELFLQKRITIPWCIRTLAVYMQLGVDTIFAMLEDAEARDLFHINLVGGEQDVGETQVWWHAPGSAGLKRAKLFLPPPGQFYVPAANDFRPHRPAVLEDE